MSKQVATLFPGAISMFKLMQYQLKTGIAISKAMSFPYNFWHEMAGYDKKTNPFEQVQNFCEAEIDFLDLFSEELPEQEFKIPGPIIFKTPGMEVIDISLDVDHKIKNYGVVVSPRAGHHSNIAEDAAIYMRDQGLTRMAIIKQKCADDIPLYVDGKRHYENFDGQIQQYESILEHLKGLTGYPSHVISICQPGPLLFAMTILRPDLVKTFGSSGSPMNTAPDTGFLSDFAKLAGEDYIDNMIKYMGHTVDNSLPGAGRKCFDARLQVLAFYMLGLEKHMENFKNLIYDKYAGNTKKAERQKTFYQWYNMAYHSSGGFIKDTFNKIFIRNELMENTFEVLGKTIGIKDYPSNVPIWALGGSNDEIAPPIQATGHLHKIVVDSMLNLLCPAGHMGLFKSPKILKEFYGTITKFILDNSDK